MDKEISDINRFQKDFWNDLDLMEDRVMDVEMSTKGAHTMLATVQEEVQDLNDLMANISNQLELVHVEDIAWCQSRISALEKPNNPANKSLWQFVTCLSCRIEDQGDLIKDLQAGLVGAKNRVSVLEMSSSMIRSRASVLSQLYPSGHVFGPLLSSFHTKFTRSSKSHCKKTTKTFHRRYPLGTNYYKEREISKLLSWSGPTANPQVHPHLILQPIYCQIIP